MAESSPWLASQPGVLAGAIPAGVFLSWNLAVTRQPGAELGLWGDAQFSSASVAFQVMIEQGWPRRWVCAKPHWSVSHTRLPVPGSRDGAQLP